VSSLLDGGIEIHRPGPLINASVCGKNFIGQNKKTRKINLGGVEIGGDAPIVVQSMTNTDTCNIRATVAQIKSLEKVGCEIVRVAVPDFKAAQALSEIIKRINIPLVADIHFDHRLAIESIKQGAAGIRINPGNVAQDKFSEIIQCAKERKVVIRIGVNSGSLQKDLLQQYGGSTAEALVQSTLRTVDFLNRRDLNTLNYP